MLARSLSRKAGGLYTVGLLACTEKYLQSGPHGTSSMKETWWSSFRRTRRSRVGSARRSRIRSGRASTNRVPLFRGHGRSPPNGTFRATVTAAYVQLRVGTLSGLVHYWDS